MILNLITLATVKSELGLSVTTYDAQITAMIPKVSSDIRRILNYDFDTYIYATFTSGSNEITLSETIEGAVFDFDYNLQRFKLGQTIYNADIPQDTYLTAYDHDTITYTMSANATDDGTYVYLGLLISQWAAVSKMIWYRISNLNTTSVENRTAIREAVGPISKTYSDSEINKQWNYPQTLIDDLGVPFAKVG